MPAPPSLRNIRLQSGSSISETRLDVVSLPICKLLLPSRNHQQTWAKPRWTRPRSSGSAEPAETRCVELTTYLRPRGLHPNPHMMVPQKQAVIVDTHTVPFIFSAAPVTGPLHQACGDRGAAEQAGRVGVVVVKQGWRRRRRWPRPEAAWRGEIGSQ